ncbi:MAG TPA: hypothetical protein PKE31_11625 [Pseudomonadota bacterium]|jgi:hypothetical protein|nr:hypothetical protein [Pseudomonadota bacterium]
MSEQPAKMQLRPPAQRTASQAQEQTLTPAQRAERELAELDRGMEPIMSPHDNPTALANPETNALQPPGGQTLTPGVSKGADPAGMTQMVMNFVIPGSGTIMRGIYGTGFVQLGLAIAALPTMLFMKWWLGLLFGIIAWVWSAATGIQLFTQSTRR